jgi:hypothetical protein
MMVFEIVAVAPLHLFIAKQVSLIAQTSWSTNLSDSVAYLFWGNV